MCCKLILNQYSNSDRIFYSSNSCNQSGFLGNVIAYYGDEFSFNYAIDPELICCDELFKEVLLLLDILRTEFYSLSSMKKICEKSNRRIIHRKQYPIMAEYGFCYESQSYKYFVKINPEKTQINFKIYVYEKEDNLYV